MKKYNVTLTADERQALLDWLVAGKAAALKRTHARILLKADAADGSPAWTDERIAAAVEVNVATVERARRRFVEPALRRRTSRCSTPRAVCDSASSPTSRPSRTEFALAPPMRTTTAAWRS